MRIQIYEKAVAKTEHGLYKTQVIESLKSDWSGC